MPEAEIRRAIPEDLDEITACLAAAYAPYRQQIPDLPDMTGGLAQALHDNPALVATRDRQLVGVALLVLADDHLKLANLAVAPAHAGQGIGRQLIAAVEALALQRHLPELRLVTHREMPQNQRLYEHLGWAQVAQRGPQIFMRKSLQQASPAETDTAANRS